MDFALYVVSDVVSGGVIYIYIYIYIERERERETLMSAVCFPDKGSHFSFPTGICVLFVCLFNSYLGQHENTHEPGLPLSYWRTQQLIVVSALGCLVICLFLFCFGTSFTLTLSSACECMPPWLSP